MARHSNGIELTKFAHDPALEHKKITHIWPCADCEAERFMAHLMKVTRTEHVEQRSWKQELYNSFGNIAQVYPLRKHCMSKLHNPTTDSRFRTS